MVVNCDPSDDFSTTWRKVFRRLFGEESPLLTRYAEVIYPDDVVVSLSDLSLDLIPLIILDEFDKVRDIHAKTLIANTIKALSDSSARVTVIVVGVADSVSDLIAEHQSIARCLRQIPMQRMNPNELSDIITSRLKNLGMSIQQDALAYIIALCRGLLPSGLDDVVEDDCRPHVVVRAVAARRGRRLRDVVEPARGATV